MDFRLTNLHRCLPPVDFCLTKIGASATMAGRQIMHRVPCTHLSIGRELRNTALPLVGRKGEIREPLQSGKALPYQGVSGRQVIMVAMQLTALL